MMRVICQIFANYTRPTILLRSNIVLDLEAFGHLQNSSVVTRLPWHRVARRMCGISSSVFILMGTPDAEPSKTAK